LFGQEITGTPTRIHPVHRAGVPAVPAGGDDSLEKTTANVVIYSQVARASPRLLPSSLNELLERGG
jgi:hypothetical protein